MYLERLEIQGFKSFANKTVFIFPKTSHKDAAARSITAIVGPNGSGKSNTADAIRWVLGEQSTKLLRGKRADDVIFAGSPTKARLGYAEVTLFLNNEDKSAAIDYAEIAITRRVYRDGESEYLINKNKVRLFDVLMLLAKANFGQKSYSIIGQGMVDQIITISPWERKEFFDEATGVKQYQIKRDQAVSRLSRSREHVLQTNSILAELEPRLRLLTRQIKKLEKRKEIEKELRGVQETYYTHVWSGLQRDIVQYREQLQIKQAIKDDVAAQLLSVQEQLARMAREESRKDVFNELQKEYAKVIAEKNEHTKSLAVLQGKMSVEYVKVGKQQLAWLEDKKLEIGNRIAEMTDSLRNVQGVIAQKQQLLENNLQKVNELSNEIALLQNNLAAAQEAAEQLKRGKLSGNWDAVRAILAQQRTIAGIHGTVSQLATADAVHQTALAVSAGSNMQAVVVDSEDVAIKCITYLKNNRLGTVTFFPLNKLKTKGIYESSRSILMENGAIGFAVELLKFDPRYQVVFDHVFGSTVIVDTVENAKVIGVGRERMVTLEGDVMERSGVMRGGYRYKSAMSWTFDGKNNQLASVEEKLQTIAVIRSNVEERQRQKEQVLSVISDLRVDMQVNDTKSKGLDNDRETVQKELARIEQELAEQQLSPEDQVGYVTQLKTQQATLEQTVVEVEARVVSCKQKIDAFNGEEEKKKQEVFRLQDVMQEFQKRLNGVAQEFTDLQVTLAKLDTKREDLEKEAQQELGANVNLEAAAAAAPVNTEVLWMEMNRLKKNLEMIGGIDPEIVDEHKEVSERYETLSTQVADVQKGIEDLEKIVTELDVVIEKQFNASFKKINTAFERYFTQIFQGGKAKLTLLQKSESESERAESDTGLSPEETAAQESMPAEPAKPLIGESLTKTGVDIYVSPPNKKVNTISALSGGERTMTSLALLCAIVECNPSPFVVMDEVDAALDEANSNRFAAILQDLSFKTQFVVITHNRVLMHVADVLYGVAMGDDGVSKTVSLDLKDADKIPAQAK